MKYLIILVAVIILPGCANLERSAKTVTDKICKLTEAEKIVFAEQLDEMTKPNRIRIECN